MYSDFVTFWQYIFPVRIKLCLQTFTLWLFSIDVHKMHTYHAFSLRKPKYIFHCKLALLYLPIMISVGVFKIQIHPCMLFFQTRLVLGAKKVDNLFAVIHYLFCGSLLGRFIHVYYISTTSEWAVVYIPYVSSCRFTYVSSCCFTYVSSYLFTYVSSCLFN